MIPTLFQSERGSMIIDSLSNISLYRNIPKSVIEFLDNLNIDSLDYGKYVLDGSNYVNIETYSTKSIESAKYESHNRYIDIQILLKGCEKIGVEDRNILSVLENYDAKRDITFYSEKINKDKTFLLNGSNFIMLFPHEAHAPQIAADFNTSENVIKLVAKIKFE